MIDDKIIKEATEAFNKNLDAGCYVGSLLEIINCLKAEIDRLETEAKLLVENNVIAKYQICVWMGDNLILSKSEQGYDNLIKDISTKAVKEFAERLKTEYSERFLVSGDTVIEILDNLLKEKVGEGEVQWNQQGECPVTPKQFMAIYNDEEEE